MRFIIRALLLIAAIACFAIARADAAGEKTCAELVAERKSAFNQLNHRTLASLRNFRTQISATRTENAAVADRELAQATAALKSLRENRTPDEQKALRSLVHTAEQRVEFWRAKRTSILLGEHVPGGEAWLPYIDDEELRLERKAKNERAEIDKLDREIADCKQRESTESAKWPNLAGTYKCVGPPCSPGDDTVTQNGQTLTFTNENGSVSKGHFLNATTVIAEDWEGGLHGAIESHGRRIVWSNGSEWIRQ